MNNKQLGQNGEDIACEYLKKQGYKIIERNVRFSRECELDIIALDKNTLVAVEVKTRKTASLGSPLEAVTKTKLQNIRKGLFYYLAEHNQYKSHRIDVVSIVLTPKTEIQHLKNI